MGREILPSGSKVPNRSYVPKTIIKIHSIETLDTPYVGPLDPYKGYFSGSRSLVTSSPEMTPQQCVPTCCEGMGQKEKQYYTILYYTILYYTILYYTILYYTILYYTILYYTILYYTILYYTILYYTILYYTILYYTILYHTILYYAMLCYTVQKSSSRSTSRLSKLRRLRFFKYLATSFSNFLKIPSRNLGPSCYPANSQRVSSSTLMLGRQTIR